MAHANFVDAMEAIPDPGLRARAMALRKTTFAETPEGFSFARRAAARILHPDVARCAVAAEALALFNAKLDNFASIVAKGHTLDVATNTWKRAEKAA